jgi:microcystin-dependent protein
MKKTITTILVALMVSSGILNTAQAFEPILGQVMLFGGNFCPRGWANADGQLLQISQNSALFSIFGTMYGGDGRTTFGLPELRGRSPIHVGRGPGLPVTDRQGEKGGSASFTLTTAQLPSHNHSYSVTIAKGRATTNQATGNYLAEAAIFRPGTSQGTAITANAGATNYAGGGQTINKRSPYQVLRYCVALVGTYPSRN